MKSPLTRADIDQVFDPTQRPASLAPNIGAQRSVVSAHMKSVFICKQNPMGLSAFEASIMV